MVGGGGGGGEGDLSHSFYPASVVNCAETVSDMH